MCTEEQAKQACKIALTERDSEGLSILERELIQEGDKIVRKLTLRFGVAVIALAVTSTVAWYNIVYRVGNLEQGMAESVVHTDEEHDKTAIAQAKVDDAQDERIAELKEDVGEQFDEVNKKLDQIQTTLYEIARGN